MSWLSSIIGGGIGAMVAGPFGAIIGAAIGASWGGGTAGRPSGMGGARGLGGPLPEAQRRQLLFFTAAYSMVGKLSQADGRVSEEEVAAIRRVSEEVLGLDEQTRRYALEVLKQSRMQSESFADYAREFGNVFCRERDLCIFMMEFLFEVAMADGTLHPAEESMLLEAKAAFRLSDADYAELHAHYVHGGPTATALADLAKHYETLGVGPDATVAEIKKAYRRKASEFHPDKIQGKGLPPEFIKFANEKLVEINAAYDAVMAVRKASG